jgi:hypothetical protein
LVLAGAHAPAPSISVVYRLGQKILARSIARLIFNSYRSRLAAVGGFRFEFWGVFL